MTPLRQRMLEELLRRNNSPATTRGYILAVKQFAEHFGRSPNRIGAEEVRRFQLYLFYEKKLAPGTMEICLSALRFLCKKTLKRRDLSFDDLFFPKTPRKLPVVLSPEEVTRLIDAAPNRMCHTILMVFYGTGIRRTEASLLKVSDIDSERMVIHIRQGKGFRDQGPAAGNALFSEINGVTLVSSLAGDLSDHGSSKRRDLGHQQASLRARIANQDGDSCLPHWCW